MPDMPDIIMPRGCDYLTTVRSDQYFELTTELLGEDYEPFAETTPFISAPLNPPMGNTDTIMERVEDCPLGKSVGTQLTAFSNVSAAPVRIQRKDGGFKYFDIYATLSPIHDSRGKVTFLKFDERTGEATFESTADFWPLLELRPLGGGESIWIDTGAVPVPGFPMTVGASGGRWSRQAAAPNEVRGYRSNPVFYRSIVMITATSANNPNAVIPMSNPPITIAKCAKAQAQFIGGGGDIARYSRINFTVSKPDSNREL